VLDFQVRGVEVVMIAMAVGGYHDGDDKFIIFNIIILVFYLLRGNRE
jgi:hypothetical protein